MKQLTYTSSQYQQLSPYASFRSASLYRFGVLAATSAKLGRVCLFDTKRQYQVSGLSALVRRGARVGLSSLVYSNGVCVTSGLFSNFMLQNKIILGSEVFNSMVDLGTSKLQTSRILGFRSIFGFSRQLFNTTRMAARWIVTTGIHAYVKRSTHKKYKRYNHPLASYRRLRSIRARSWFQFFVRNSQTKKPLNRKISRQRAKRLNGLLYRTKRYSVISWWTKKSLRPQFLRGFFHMPQKMKNALTPRVLFYAERSVLSPSFGSPLNGDANRYRASRMFKSTFVGSRAIPRFVTFYAKRKWAHFRRVWTPVWESFSFSHYFRKGPTRVYPRHWKKTKKAAPLKSERNSWIISYAGSNFRDSPGYSAMKTGRTFDGSIAHALHVSSAATFRPRIGKSDLSRHRWDSFQPLYRAKRFFARMRRLPRLVKPGTSLPKWKRRRVIFRVGRKVKFKLRKRKYYLQHARRKRQRVESLSLGNIFGPSWPKRILRKMRGTVRGNTLLQRGFESRLNKGFTGQRSIGVSLLKKSRTHFIPRDVSPAKEKTVPVVISGRLGFYSKTRGYVRLLPKVSFTPRRRISKYKLKKLVVTKQRSISVGSAQNYVVTTNTKSPQKHSWLYLDSVMPVRVRLKRGAPSVRYFGGVVVKKAGRRGSGCVVANTRILVSLALKSKGSRKNYSDVGGSAFVIRKVSNFWKLRSKISCVRSKVVADALQTKSVTSDKAVARSTAGRASTTPVNKTHHGKKLGWGGNAAPRRIELPARRFAKLERTPLERLTYAMRLISWRRRGRVLRKGRAAGAFVYSWRTSVPKAFRFYKARFKYNKYARSFVLRRLTNVRRIAQVGIKRATARVAARWAVSFGPRALVGSCNAGVAAAIRKTIGSNLSSLAGVGHYFVRDNRKRRRMFGIYRHYRAKRQSACQWQRISEYMREKGFDSAVERMFMSGFAYDTAWRTLNVTKTNPRFVLSMIQNIHSTAFRRFLSSNGAPVDYATGFIYSSTGCSTIATLASGRTASPYYTTKGLYRRRLGFIDKFFAFVLASGGVCASEKVDDGRCE